MATPKVKKKILFPVKVDAVMDPVLGTQVSPVVPELWGAPVEVVEIAVNYHDVCKAVVRGAERDVAALAEKSRAYFAALWGKPDDEGDE